MLNIILINFFVSILIFIFTTLFLKKYNFYDHPHKLKIHKVKKLSQIGAYINISIIFLLVTAYNTYSKELYYLQILPRFYILIICLISFIIISLYDFKKNINPIARLFIQFLLAYTSISSLPYVNGEVFLLFDFIKNERINILLIIFIWLLIINVTNFIDGIDLLSANYIITFSICLLISSILKSDYFLMTISLSIPILSLPFIYLNWYPSKLFFGDAGSIPFGLFAGWILFILFFIDCWEIIVIGSLYFVLDIIITDILKFIKKENIFERHNDFLFHKKLLLGNSPLIINIKIVFINFFLIIIGVISHIYNLGFYGVILGIIIILIY